MKVGWGRSFKRAVATWYTEKPASKLAYLVTKYKQREGWSHKDAVRLAHPKVADDAEKSLVVAGIVKGIPDALKSIPDGSDAASSDVFTFFSALQDLNKLEGKDVEKAIAIVQQHKLAHEHIPAPFLSAAEMWVALLDHMPLTAMMRNLGRMSKIGVFSEVPAMTDLVCERLVDPEGLKAGRIHPFNVLVAQRTYASGHGMRGSLNWTVEPRIATALEQAFYASFGNVESTGQRVMVALDVSGSMMCPIVGTPVLTARDAAAAMSMVVLRSEPSVIVRGFCNTFRKLDISAESTLDQVIQATSHLSFGGTDCALPMVHAIQNDLEVDTFIVYTDSETYSPNQSPSDALADYRRKSGINAKLIVVGMASNGFTIADPNDRGMLDVVGFDTNAPSIMAEFMAGKL
jgi:60 kDa SS-A/Ro ribonucleoprotein